MNKVIARILGLISLLILLYLSVALIANIAQLANVADRIYLGLGQGVFQEKCLPQANTHRYAITKNALQTPPRTIPTLQSLLQRPPLAMFDPP